jgi:hypothetical protein
MALDDKTVRGIVLAIIRAYRDINEAEFEETTVLLQHAPSEEVRKEAAATLRIWVGTKEMDRATHSKLIRYRLRLVDEGVQRLEVQTRLKEQNA